MQMLFQPWSCALCFIPMRKSDVLCFSRKVCKWYHSLGTQSNTLIRSSLVKFLSSSDSINFLCKYRTRKPLAGSTLLEKVTILRKWNALAKSLNTRLSSLLTTQENTVTCYQSKSFIHNQPEAEMKAMVCHHLHWLIACSNNVRAKKNIAKFRPQSGLTHSHKYASAGHICAGEVYHLWYLQVRAPLTSSLIEAGSWISSRITTSGISVALLSRSIWLAKLER